MPHLLQQFSTLVRENLNIFHLRIPPFNLKKKCDIVFDVTPLPFHPQLYILLRQDYAILMLLLLEQEFILPGECYF